MESQRRTCERVQAQVSEIYTVEMFLTPPTIATRVGFELKCWHDCISPLYAFLMFP